MKIQEVFYQTIPFNAVELPKKTDAISTERSANIDSYVAGNTQTQVEKEVFGMLRDMVNDLFNGVDQYGPDSKNKIAVGNPLPQASGLVETPIPQSDILVLLLYKKDEVPEHPFKVFVSYQVRDPLTEGAAYQGQVKNDLVDALVKKAKQYIPVLMGKVPIPTDDGKDNDFSGNETGYVVRFPGSSQLLLGEEVREVVAPQGGENKGSAQSIPEFEADLIGATRAESVSKEGNDLRPFTGVWGVTRSFCKD